MNLDPPAIAFWCLAACALLAAVAMLMQVVMTTSDTLTTQRSLAEEQCPVCGYYCLGKGGIGCIDKPSLMTLTSDMLQRIHDTPIEVARKRYSELS